jgi:parallel beta-helix repeat protein
MKNIVIVITAIFVCLLSMSIVSATGDIETDETTVIETDGNNIENIEQVDDVEPTAVNNSIEEKNSNQKSDKYLSTVQNSENSVSNNDPVIWYVNPYMNQQLIDMILASMRDGDVLFFQDGTYNDLQLNVNNAINITANSGKVLLLGIGGYNYKIAITVTTSNVNISNLNISNYWRGVRFSGSDNRVSNCYLNESNCGVDSQSPRNEIINCTFSYNENGANTFNSGSYTKFVNCIFSNNICDGIALGGWTVNNQVINCNFYENGECGIDIDSYTSANQIINSSFIHNSIAGIRIDNSNTNEIINCISTNNSIGVLVRGNNNSIIDSQVNFNEKGVLIQGSNNIVENNEISYNNEGVRLESNGSLITNNQIIGNEITNNNIGICIIPINLGNTTIHNNTYLNNTEDIGIRL